MVEVLDGWAPPGLVEAAIATWPSPHWEHWHRYSGPQGDKLATKDPARLTPACRLLVEMMAQTDAPNGWFPDLDLHGAGMHWIRPGGRLPKHLDSERHPLRPWLRRRNAILYLDTPVGGELVIDEAGEIRQVAPVRNRLLIFESNHPHEVLPVESGERRSLSLFWWEVAANDSPSLSISATWL